MAETRDGPRGGSPGSAYETRELRSSAALDNQRRTALTPRAAGYSYREIQQLLGVTYTWANRHLTEGRAQLRRHWVPSSRAPNALTRGRRADRRPIRA